MFGPNNKTAISQKINFHHREETFFSIYKDIQEVFKDKFNISNDYDLVIVNGSGTLAIETVIFSFLGKFKVDGYEGKFKTRWESLLSTYKKLDKKNGKSFYCQLETSNSSLQTLENSFFVDCISSFPYVDPPKESHIWATVSSKCLGSVPVLGLIVYKKSLKDLFIDKSFYSYLNLSNLIEFKKTYQTPQTPPMPLYMDLLEKLKTFDTKNLRDLIDYRCDRITEILGKENFVGNTRCPVLTFDKSLLKSNMDKYNIYGSNSIGSTRQIFVYSQDEKEFNEFIRDLKK